MTNNNEIKFHYSEPFLSNDVDSRINNAQFSVCNYYFNNSNEDVIVIHRNNLPIKISKSVNGFTSNRKFTVKTVYTFHDNSIIIETINTIAELSSHYNKNEDLDLIRQVLLNNYNNDRLVNFSSVAIERNVDINVLKQQEHVYLPDCDLLLSFRSLDVNTLHPFSANGQISSEYHKFVSNRRVSGVFIELIDNENNIGNRYMYVANQVIEIPVRKDITKKSGVYFTKASCDKLDDIQMSTEYFEFDKGLDYLGLHRNRDDAVTNGNPDLLTKTRLKDLELGLANAKLDLESKNLESEAILKNLQTELERSKQETLSLKEKIEQDKAKRTDLYEERSKYRSDLYEDRSMQRKDAHEIIKHIPSIALGIITIIALVNNKSSK